MTIIFNLCCNFIFWGKKLPVSDHGSDQMYKFVLDIVQYNLLLLSAFHETHVVPLHNGIELDGSQCCLRQHCLNLAVRHVVHMWVRMHAGARILAEWGYTIVAGNLP